MVDHEVDPLDLAEGFDAWEKPVPWGLESSKCGGTRRNGDVGC